MLPPSPILIIEADFNIPFKEELHDDITKAAPNLKLYPGKNSTAEYTSPLLFLVWSASDVKLHQN
ncbi:hypothetical protein L798_00885 [Zootermopsis nevadensis]|uniref:Uncharacterized protein n=1 Tax=Zootermopsis nevadensis TaxID=136037 RepID=A0A067QJ51_ZOONE|nr:hypothetical protein L798_00885 [Zootermopsis nevadensis]